MWVSLTAEQLVDKMVVDLAVNWAAWTVASMVGSKASYSVDSLAEL